MKREIKFRGKSKLGMNPIVTGFLLIDEMDNHFISFKPDDDSFQLIPVFEESVGEFTGLKDKNGKEVYEGDTTDSGETVVFENGAFRTTFEDNRQGSALLTEKRTSVIEIVGNIY